MSGLQPTILSDIADSVLASAEACLDQNGIEVPPQVGKFWLKPPDDCCDWLAVWLRRIRPTGVGRPFPASVTAVSPECQEVHMAVDMSVGMVRDCFPNVRNDRADPFPPLAEGDAAAAELLEAARVMWCCLQASYSAGTLLPADPEPDGPQPDIVWGEMLPWRGGGCAGFEWQFTVEVPACCWDPPQLGS